MSQPPSLPKLTALLRPGQQQQHYQQPDVTNRPPSGGDDAARGVEKRRLDGAVHRFEPSIPEQPYRQKSRANLFVQYGETNFHGAQQQHDQTGYDRRPPQYAQQPPAHHRQVPYPAPSAQLRILQPPPPPSLHQRHPYATDFDRNSSIQAMSDTSPRGDDSLGTIQQDARRVHPVKSAPPPARTQEPVQRERKSRYLSDADRRSIILRIENGEKQVALAKEYQVSRAAVCNLYKNRKEVLTRATRDAKIKHLKRSKDKDRELHSRDSIDATTLDSPTEEKEISDGLHGDDELMSDELSSTESIGAEPPRGHADSDRSPIFAQRRAIAQEQVLRVHNASTTSFPIRRLVSILRNAQLPQTTLRQVTRRLVNNLIEEVVVCLPHREANVLTPSGDTVFTVLPLEDGQICAVSIEDQSTIILQAFLDIFPGAPTGLVSLSWRTDQSPAAGVWTATSTHHLPLVHDSACVLLLTTSCTTGSRVSAALDYLVGFGHLNPSNIYVTSVVATHQGIAYVHKHFPGVSVVSATIDDGLDERGHIRPGLGNLMERFWHFQPNPPR